MCRQGRGVISDFYLQVKEDGQLVLQRKEEREESR